MRAPLPAYLLWLAGSPNEGVSVVCVSAQQQFLLMMPGAALISMGLIDCSHTHTTRTHWEELAGWGNWGGVHLRRFHTSHSAYCLPAASVS